MSTKKMENFSRNKNPRKMKNQFPPHINILKAIIISSFFGVNGGESQIIEISILFFF
jgi:hypothetical protein